MRMFPPYAARAARVRESGDFVIRPEHERIVHVGPLPFCLGPADRVLDIPPQPRSPGGRTPLTLEITPTLGMPPLGCHIALEGSMQ